LNNVQGRVRRGASLAEPNNFRNLLILLARVGFALGDVQIRRAAQHTQRNLEILQFFTPEAPI
jgi:hypothetical protein